MLSMESNVTKINKTQARKLFNDGVMIYLLPCRVGFNNCWIVPHSIIKGEDEHADFDRILNNFEYYNCGYGLGNYTAFYTKN